MEKKELKMQIKRLVDEAIIIAPSIINFEKDGKYGRITDEDFDFDSYITWEMETETILYHLSGSNSDVLSGLYKKYIEYKNKEKLKNWHSKSILVHKILQLLKSAFKLLDSPLSNIKNSKIVQKNVNSIIEHGYAFIAMPMDPEDKTLVDVLDAVKEAALKCGIRAERIDEPQSNERITDRIIESIQRAEYVIVDLSKSKPNVFFEAGYAHGLGKIPIYFAKYGTQLEFDLKDYPVIFFESLRELKESIEKRIKGLMEKK